MAQIVTLNDIRRATQLHINQCGFRGYARAIKCNYGHLWSFIRRAEYRPPAKLLKALGYRRVQTEVYERVR